MAFTQTDLDRIDAELASVNHSVQAGDRVVVRRRIDELVKQRAIIAQAVEAAAAASGGVQPVRMLRLWGAKGV